MKKYMMSLIAFLLAVLLCACSIRMDGKGLNSTETEEFALEEVDSEEVASEEDHPGADVVEIVNLRGDETTVYKLADGTYMDRIERHFTYNGTDTWIDEDGVEWNEVVK